KRMYAIDTTSIAAFAQGSLNVTEDLRATVGLRWSEDDKDLVTTQDVVAPLTSVSDSDSWSSVTYRLGLDYKITPDTMVYASVAEGFKAGGLNNSATRVNALRPYDPEE